MSVERIASMAIRGVVTEDKNPKLCLLQVAGPLSARKLRAPEAHSFNHHIKLFETTIYSTALGTGKWPYMRVK